MMCARFSELGSEGPWAYDLGMPNDQPSRTAPRNRMRKGLRLSSAYCCSHLCKGCGLARVTCAKHHSQLRLTPFLVLVCMWELLTLTRLAFRVA